jgi:hypothetical protein
MSTQPLNRTIRELLARMVTSGAPALLDMPFSPAGFRLILARKKTRGVDEVLAPFSVRAPTSVTQYLWSSSVLCPGLSGEDRAVLRDEIETILFQYLNPIDVLRGTERSVWLLSETEQSQLARVLALAPEDELDYIFMVGDSPQWTGPIRGVHKAMAALAQILSRHPDFATGKVVCRPPATFLFLGEARSLDRVPTAGIGIDGRNVPGRGIFAIDPNSYMDALVQLGEDEARDLAAVEFGYTGTCIRAQGPLGIPMYRIPHAVHSDQVRSITLVNGNRRIFETTVTPAS